MNARSLDHSVVAELKDLSTGDTPDFFVEQVALFSWRGDGLVASLEEASKARDRDAVMAYAHALAGSAAAIGAARLSALCLDLEDRADGWEDGRVRLAVMNVRAAYDEARRQLALEAREV